MKFIYRGNHFGAFEGRRAVGRGQYGKAATNAQNGTNCSCICPPDCPAVIQAPLLLTSVNQGSQVTSPARIPNTAETLGSPPSFAAGR